MQTTLPDLPALRAKLLDRNLAEIARRTGIHRNVLYRFVNGGGVMRYENILKLVRYFESA